MEIGGSQNNESVEQFDLSSKEQEKISRTLNAKNIDDKTKFLMLAALQSEIHK